MLNTPPIALALLRVSALAYLCQCQAIAVAFQLPKRSNKKKTTNSPNCKCGLR